MPARGDGASHVECGDEEVDSGRQPTQMGWYASASKFVKGRSVLDVGCGMGKGLALLAEHARSAHGIDRDERLKNDHVFIKDIADVEDNAYDVVVCIDVIEHVEDDQGFLDHLFRVAREMVFLSTPNWSVNRCGHKYHIREYTPYEFQRLFQHRGDVTFYKGDAQGMTVSETRPLWFYVALNACQNFGPLNIPTRILKRMTGLRIYEHQAAVARLQ